MTSLALNFLGGAPFQLLYDGVKIAIRTTKKFRTHLENLEFTLECLQPRIIQQISANNVQLNIPNDLIRDLETKMEEGKELVYKLSRLGIWNIRIWGNCCNCIMPNYADQLAGLDRSLRRLLEILKLEQIRNVQENLRLARNHNDKQDALDQKVSELLKVHKELLKAQKDMCDMMSVQHDSVHHAMQRILVDVQNGRGESAPAPAPAPAYALGIVFRKLFDVVIQVKVKNTMCKRLIREFKSTLDFLKPLIEEMSECNKVLHLPEQEQEDFIMQMTKGVELIHKYSKVCKWASYKKYECTNKLLKLDASLQVLVHKLSLQIAKHGKEALVSINSTEAVIKKIEGSSVVQNQIQSVARIGLDVLNTHGRKDAEGTRDDMNEKEVGVKQIEGNGMRQNVKEIEGLSEVPETSSPITGLDVQGTKDTNGTLDSERRNIEAQTKQIEGTSRVAEAPVSEYKRALLDEFKTSTHKILVTSRSECPQFGSPYYPKSEKSLNDEGTMTDLKGKKLKRGLWSREEDEMLSRYITTHGLGSWSEVPEKAGLQRSAKSCRLRWINYLRPGIRRPSSKHLRFPPEDPLYSRYGEIMKERSLLPFEIKDQCPPNVKNTLDDEASGSTQKVNQVNAVDGQSGGSSKQLISTDRIGGGIPDKQQGVKERVALRTKSEEGVYFYIPTHKSANNKPNPRDYYVGVSLVPWTTSGVFTVKLDQIFSRFSKLWFEEERHPLLGSLFWSPLVVRHMYHIVNIELYS